MKSIQALKDLHFDNDNTDYSKEFNLDYIYDYLYHKGISSNYNEPMTYDQIKRLGEERARTIFNNIKATKNMVNIQQVKGEDLGIVEKDKYEYLFTYSFPCQDLSLAGLRKGMKKGDSTRSGMLWEVERILDECKELNTLPNILFMENVPEVIGKSNIKDFQKWIEKLESLGYSNYVECLNSKDYGVPQNRNRCFMISILGEYSYKFPLPFKLKLRLKDLLESNVDEKYYLSSAKIKSISNWKAQQDPLKDINKEKEISPSPTLTARGAGEEHSGMILINERIYIKEATQKGYAEAHEGDGVYINRPHQKRGVVQKGMIQTLKTSSDVGVVVYDDYNSKIRQDQNTIGTITTNIGNNAPRNGYKIIEYKDKELADTLQTNPKELRIRKLTSREVFRLMGVKDEDFDKIKKNQSDSSLYHLAGDSIVVDVMKYMFKNLL